MVILRNIVFLHSVHRFLSEKLLKIIYLLYNIPQAQRSSRLYLKGPLRRGEKGNSWITFFSKSLTFGQPSVLHLPRRNRDKKSPLLHMAKREENFFTSSLHPPAREGNGGRGGKACLFPWQWDDPVSVVQRCCWVVYQGCYSVRFVVICIRTHKQPAHVYRLAFEMTRTDKASYWDCWVWLSGDCILNKMVPALSELMAFNIANP